MPLDGLIFDLDGTLVDTNELHVRAWVQVFERHGYRVAADRVRAEIGKGGDNLVPAVLGHEADRTHGERLRKQQPEAFAELARDEGVRVFDGVRELLEACRQRGLRLALATSSGRAHLDVIQSAAGVKLEPLFDQIVTSDDADQSKPAPDLIIAAAEKLDLHPAQCALVGDSPYDITSAKHAGVVTIGLTGGSSRPDALCGTGARLIHRDPADLLSHLDDALATVSPARVSLTRQRLEAMMQHALDAAEQAMQKGDVPIGSALLDGDGHPIATAHNEMATSGNKTAHAEIVTFARAAGKLPLEARDSILVSTLEPCVMCTGAAMEAAVDTIVYALKAPADSGTGRVRPPVSPESQMPRIVGGIRSDESRALLKRWLDRNGDNPQAAFVRQLLKLTADEA